MPVRIDSIGQVLLRKELKEYIKSLEPGDVVKGRVIESNNGEVTIKATNGQVIKVDISTDMHLEEGQYIEMQVDNVDEDIVYASLKAVEKRPGNPEELLKTLIRNMGLPSTAANLAIAKTLIKNNLPVNLETISGLVSQLKSSDILSKASPESVIGLLASGNDLRNTNIDVLGKIAINFESDVRKYISEYESLDGNEEKFAFPEFDEDGNEISTSNKSIKAEVKADAKTAVNADENVNIKIDGKVDIKVAANADTKEPIAHVVLDRKDLPKNFSEISSIYKNNGAFSKDSSDGETESITSEGKTEKINPEAIKSILEKVGVKATPEIEAFIEKTANILSKLYSVSPDKLAWLASKGLEATPANLESLDNHINSTNKITYLLDELDNQLSVYSDPNLKNLREIIANLSIRPHELTEVDMVKETIRDLVKAGENIDVYLSKSGINDDGIRNTLSNVKDNIDFMRQINQYSNFIQIPLQMNEKNATADLYVYKDKSRSKLIDPEDATIIIALDLPKSGRIESMIKLNGKRVNATFRLEKSDVGITIKRGEKILSDRLEARGYRLEPIKTIQLNEFFNLIKMEELIGSASIDRLHFDLRV